jgi:hypothetical protein
MMERFARDVMPHFAHSLRQSGDPPLYAPSSVSSALASWRSVVSKPSVNQVAGHVEHVVSGRATHFCTLNDLLAFMARVVADLGYETPEEA